MILNHWFSALQFCRNISHFPALQIGALLNWKFQSRKNFVHHKIISVLQILVGALSMQSDQPLPYYSQHSLNCVIHFSLFNNAALEKIFFEKYKSNLEHRPMTNFCYRSKLGRNCGTKQKRNSISKRCFQPSTLVTEVGDRFGMLVIDFSH